MSISIYSSTKSDTSNSNHFSSNNSVFSNISNKFSHIIGNIIFILSQTEIGKYFEDKRKVIQEKFNEKKAKYEALFYILDAFKDIQKDNPDIESFNQHIKKLMNIYDKEKDNFDKIISSDVKKINRFIIFNSLILNFINIVCVEKKKESIHLKIKEGETEEKAIQNYICIIEKLIKNNLKEIKDFSDLFLSRSLIKVLPNNYKIYEKFTFHYIIDKIPKESEQATIYNYFEDKIYSFSKYLIFSFEIKDINYKIKYDKEIYLPKYDGKKNHFFLYGIIYEENLEYISLVKNPSEEKNWKKLDDKNIEDFNISKEYLEEKPNPIVLIYKKDDKDD